MATFDEFMTQASIGFVQKSNYFCTLIKQGVENTKLKLEIRLMGMILHALVSKHESNSLTDEEAVLLSTIFVRICQIPQIDPITV